MKQRSSIVVHTVLIASRTRTKQSVIKTPSIYVAILGPVLSSPQIMRPHSSPPPSFQTLPPYPVNRRLFGWPMILAVTVDKSSATNQHPTGKIEHVTWTWSTSSASATNRRNSSAPITSVNTLSTAMLAQVGNGLIGSSKLASKKNRPRYRLISRTRAMKTHQLRAHQWQIWGVSTNKIWLGSRQHPWVNIRIKSRISPLPATTLLTQA